MTMHATIRPTAASPAETRKLSVSRGTILLFSLPDKRDDAEDAFAPCLVLESETWRGKTFLTLAPGEPHPPALPRGYEIAVWRRPALAHAGLGEPFMFYAHRRLLVPTMHRGFVSPIPQGILGRLEGQELDRMNAVRARIHAVRDIADDHRRRRREQVQSGRRRPMLSAFPARPQQQYRQETQR